MTARSFVGKVGNDGRLTIPSDIRYELGINENDFVKIDIEKLNLFISSTHRLYDPNRGHSAVTRQASVTNFNSKTSTRNVKKPTKKYRDADS